MCRVLKVKHSSYYDWLSRDISEQQIRHNHGELLVKVLTLKLVSTTAVSDYTQS
jgi:hypothetical protein